MGKVINFDKLKGRENYAEWQRRMLAFLRTRKLANCIAEDPLTEKDEEKLQEAMGWLYLACEETVTHHFNDIEKPLAVWKKLKKSFSESGLDREVAAIVGLIATTLDNSESIDDFIGRMMAAWKKCSDAEVVIEDKIVALLMISQLGQQYQPFVMGFSASGKEINVENVKSALMTLVTSSVKIEKAFFGGTGNKSVKNLNKVKCYGCGQLGHYKNKCPNGNGNQHILPKNVSSSVSGSKKSIDAKFANAFSSYIGERCNDDWFIDSGASRHMTPRQDILIDYRRLRYPDISVANDQKMQVHGCGTAHIVVEGVEITVQNVLHVPQLGANLLSVNAMIEAGNIIEFNADGCKVMNGQGDLVAQAKSSNGTYKIDGKYIKCMLAKNNRLIEWHRKMGHISFEGLKAVQKAVSGIDFNETKDSIKNCVSCAEGKQPRAVFHKRDVEIKTKGILELIHMDVCGPMDSSLGGARYFLVFIDDYSRKVFVSFLREKSFVAESFRSFKATMENQVGRRIKRLRSDNGTEFVNKAMERICADAGIIHEKTVPYTPQQNGIAERMNRTLVERARCMLSDSDLNKKLWAEAVHHAAYLINRSVNRSVGDRTPEEVWSDKKPDLSELKIFGNPAMVQVPKVKRTKWDAKAIEMNFVGYADNQKGFRFFDPLSKKIIISRDVIFLLSKAVKIGSSFIVDDNNDEPTVSVGDKQEETKKEVDSIDNQCSEASGVDKYFENHNEEEFEDATDEPSITITPSMECDLRRSSRVSCPVIRYDSSYLASDCADEDPLNRAEAIKSHDRVQWMAAMKDELKSFEINNTWTLVELPPDRKPIRTMWVFKRKRAENGTVVRHKARLVAKGCSQQFGIDYSETYSPVVRYGSIRLLIALAAQRGLEIDQMDAVTAYLQGTLDEEIYTFQPEGFDDGSGRVCKLYKAMYGLKQSGRKWNQCLDAALKSFGLNRSEEDPCVYYNGNCTLIIAIYVDDFLIFWKDSSIRDELKMKLSTTFHMKDLGRAETCVGIKIVYEENFISINQERYAREILKRFGMENCNQVTSPCDVAQKLTSRSNGSPVNVPYREAVGSLLFLVQGTRPDLAFAVSNVSRFNDKHDASHWNGVKRIMRYLKGTCDYRIAYRRNCDEPLNGYADADWANERDECRSYSGFVFKLAGGAISWSCKRQTSVAVSSTEAEYVAMAHAIKEAIWLVRFIRQFEKLNTIVLHGDNQSAMVIISREGFNGRTKHIDVGYHFCRQHVISGLISMKYVPSAENIADCLTKGVGKLKMLLGCIGFGLVCANGKLQE